MRRPKLAVRARVTLRQVVCERAVHDHPLGNQQRVRTQVHRAGVGDDQIIGGDRLAAQLRVEVEAPRREAATLENIVERGVRPEQISDSGTVQRTARSVYARRFRIELVEPTGPDTLLFVRINGETVCCRVRPEQACAAGESMELAVDLSKAVFFDPDSGKRIG